MSYWLEILCDIRIKGHNACHDAHCYSHRNANPGVMSGNTTALREGAVRALTIEAKAKGWRRTRKGWSCPGCQKAEKWHRDDRPKTAAQPKAT